MSAIEKLKALDAKWKNESLPVYTRQRALVRLQDKLTELSPTLLAVLEAADDLLADHGIDLEGYSTLHKGNGHQCWDGCLACAYKDARAALESKAAVVLP